MFTGLIENIGEVKAYEMLDEKTARLTIFSPINEVIVGESIAVDGVCLTCLPGSEKNHLLFDLSIETRQITTLTSFEVGRKVHIERAMLANGRFGGHYISGHVDTTLTLLSKISHGECLQLSFGKLDKQTTLFVIPKGSISIDGVSLTVNQVNQDEFNIMLIPHTLKHTHLGEMNVGQKVNIEFDYFARLIAHQMSQLKQVTKED